MWEKMLVPDNRATLNVWLFDLGIEAQARRI